MPEHTPQPAQDKAALPWNGHELDEAAERALDAYLTIALRVYERLLNDPEAYAAYRRLTTPTYVRTMKSEKAKTKANETP